MTAVTLSRESDFVDELAHAGSVELDAMLKQYRSMYQTGPHHLREILDCRIERIKGEQSARQSQGPISRVSLSRRSFRDAMRRI